MTDEKIYTNLSFGFEIEVIGKCRKLHNGELAALHSAIKKKLEHYLLNFKLPTYPDFELNEIGDLPDYEGYSQVE